MDTDRFDALTRVLSRRRGLGVLTALGFSVLAAPARTEAKKKACPPCKKRKKGKCKGTLPDGTACDGGTCQTGTCVTAPPPPGPPVSPPPPLPPFDAYCNGLHGNYCNASGKCACVKDEQEAWICIQPDSLRFYILNCTECEANELCVVRNGVIWKNCALPCTNPV